MPILAFLRPYLRELPMAALALLAASGTVLNAQVSSASDGFNPSPNGAVAALALQPNGQILVGGYFNQIQPNDGAAQSTPYLARLNHDGTYDPSVSPGLNGSVSVITVEPNGQILAGGAFTTAQPSGSSASIACNHLIRLNADGSIDTSFNPNIGGDVYAVAVQANGQIVIGGAFTSVQGVGSTSPILRRHIARLNADGSLDGSFDPEANATVLSLAIQPNGQIIMGGGFATLQPNGTASPATYHSIARLNADGSADSTFNPDANGAINSIVILTDGKILIGGAFTSLTPLQAAGNTTQVDSLARLNADGSLDSSFIVNPLAAVSSIALQADGKVVIGGTFTEIYPVDATAEANVNYIARINPDGSLDTSFAPNPNQAVNAILVQPDGEIILGGYFDQLEPNLTSIPTNRNCLARVDINGNIDATLSPDTLGRVQVAAIQANGQILIGGTFASVAGVTHNFLARLNADGSIDASFNPTVDASVTAIAVQSDGKIVIGGNFAYVDGISRNYIARLNSDGTLDGPYNPNPDGVVAALAVQADGKIIAGGNFTFFEANGATAVTQRDYIARLNTDGTLDSAYDPEANGEIFTIVLQSSGQAYIGGNFTLLTPNKGPNEIGREFIALLNTDGTPNQTYFNPVANGPVYAIVLQPNGKVVLGGNFTGLEPQTGSSSTSATTPTVRNYIARINADGTLDTSFNPSASASILSLALQSNGDILAAGNFTSFEPNGAATGTLRYYVARLNSNGTVDPSFTTGTDAQVDFVTVLANGQILLGGAFTLLQPAGGADVSADHVAILNSDGTVSTSFAIGSSSTSTARVNAAVLEPDGGLIIAGAFSNFAGASNTNLARFNSDGSTDTGFNPDPDGPINAVAVLPNGAATPAPTDFGAWLNANGTLRYALSSPANGQITAVAQQPNGQLLIGGLFTGLQGIPVPNFARMNTDGTIDASFMPLVNGQVSAILVQPNGQIVIGGDFTTIGSVTMNYIARLNADGTLDTSFNPNANGNVEALALQPNGQIIIGGDFTAFQPNGANAQHACAYIGRLNTDGTLDTAFLPTADSTVQAVAVLPSGQIMVGGSFTTFQPNGGATVVSRDYIARINPGGTVDANYYPDPNNPVSCLVVQSNGQVVVGGGFSLFQPNFTGTTYPIKFLARLNTDGTIDTSYDPNPNGSVVSLALRPNGEILAGGVFTSLNSNNQTYASTLYSLTRHFVTLLNTDGTIDPSFDPNANGQVGVVVSLADDSIFLGGVFTSVQSGGAFLIGGAFAHIGTALTPNLARLDFDGSNDPTFTTNPDGEVSALATQSDGSIVVAGAFAHVAGQPRNNLARLNADGSLDATFNPNANGAVNTAAIQSDGAILVGGSFTAVGGQAQAHIARLTATGAVDGTFAPAINGSISSVLVEPNDQIVIGGTFTSVSGQARSNLVRLNSDGSVDPSFNPGPNGPVDAITLQADGTLMVSGSFTTIAGQNLRYAARLTALGIADTTFNPGLNGPVDAIAVQPDAKVILGGSFTSSDGLPRFQFARISALTQATQSLSISSDDSTLTWTRGGGSPELTSVEFEESTDGVNWNTLGQAMRVGTVSTWQLGGLAAPATATFYVRARGVAPTSQFGSSSLIETVQSFYVVPPPILVTGARAIGTAGSPFTFQVAAANSPTVYGAAATYGATGLPAGLTLNATTGVISGTPTQTGTFTVSVTAANSGGTAASTVTLVIAPSAGTGFTAAPGSLSSRLINVSELTTLGGTQTQTLGFVITGTGSKTVLLRAVGPGLASFGVPNPVAAPLLQLYSGDGTLLARNEGWGGGSSLAATFAQVGAFGLASNSADDAIVSTLAPGAYTITVTDPAGTGGQVLAEVYDAAPSPLTASQRIANLSARGVVDQGPGQMVAGFVISGSSIKSVLIRGVGPALANFGVTDALPNPVLAVYTSNGTLIAQNYSWSTQISASSYQPAVGAADIVNAETVAGAYALPAGSSDTALIVNLPPGAYTVQVKSANGTAGEAVAEAYELH